MLRDVGLLEPTVARPATSVGGADAYPCLISTTRLSADNDEAYELIVAIAEGRLDSVPAIREVLTGLVAPAD